MFQGYEGYGKGLFKQFLNISTCQWNFLLSETTAFFLSEKKIWLINVSLITFRVQYVVGNMQAVITLDSFLCQSELLKQL